MPSRLEQLKLVRLFIAGLLVFLAAGALIALLPPNRHVAATQHPVASSSPSPTLSANPSQEPQVAGAATSQASQSHPNQPSSSSRSHTSTTPSPTLAAPTPSHINLQITSGGTSSFSINYTPNLDACSILTEAKAEGKISSVTLIYFSSFQSYYVKEINGQPDNWTFKYNGASPPVGCSKVPLHPGDTVAWSYQK